MVRKDSRIADILNKLMSEKQLSVTQLAKSVNLPQPTIYRIANAMCEHPHLSSLQPIARFFSISVNQLKGHEPIPWLDHISKVPLLEWSELNEWSVSIKKKQNRTMILTDADVGKSGFAVRVEDNSMDPVFPKNTVLISDPEKQAKDRSFVIVKFLRHPVIVFRQLLIDAENHYLKALSPDFDRYKISPLNPGDEIISVVVQAKRDCIE